MERNVPEHKGVQAWWKCLWEDGEQEGGYKNTAPMDDLLKGGFHLLWALTKFILSHYGFVRRRRRRRITALLPAYEPDVIIVLILYGFRTIVGGLRKNKNVDV